MRDESESVFLNEAYLSLLGRMPDSGGASTYLAWLKKGKERSDVIYSLISSPEFSGKQKRWAEVHFAIVKLLRGDVSFYKYYAEILEHLAESRKLPARQSDLSDAPSRKFFLIDGLIVKVVRYIQNFGLIFDACSDESEHVAVDEIRKTFSFVVNDKVIAPVEFGSKFLLQFNCEASFRLSIKRVKTDSIYRVVDFNDTGIVANHESLNVAIVGRFESKTSIGALSVSFLQHLFEKYNCFLVDTRPSDSSWGSLDERYLPLKSSPTESPNVDVAIFTDVFSNGLSDENYKKVPAATIKIAYVVFDSSRLPSWWIDPLNTDFDAVITTSKWGKEMIEKSGVNIPVFYLPLSLTLDSYRTPPSKKRIPEKFRFGVVASFSDRKNLGQLVRCFYECFGSSDDVELLIHSPLSYGKAYDEVLEFISNNSIENIIISHSELNEFNYVSLMNSFDVYVLLSKGECYSITPRQAFALGKPAIISAGHAHDEIIESGLFSSIKVAGYEPATYEAFSGQAIGLQCYYSDRDICDSLRKAYYNFQDFSRNANLRIEYAEKFSNASLEYYYANLVSPKNIFLGVANEIYKDGICTNSRALYEKYRKIKNKASVSNGLRYKFQKIVVPVHDGGFFSVFNTFISHFVWNFGRSDVAVVVPDWRVTTLSTYRGNTKPMSFCYGTPGDGNIFTKIFLPIPDMPMALSDYDNEDFLSGEAIYYDDFNEKNEPLLTYIHARELYRSSDFQEWRSRYNRFYNRYFKLKDSVLTQIEYFKANHFDDAFMIGVHIKHPSHAIEQSNGFMPGVTQFVKAILDCAESRNLVNYRVFLATDQEAVVTSLKEIFGKRLVVRSDVVRTSHHDDAVYKELPSDQQLKEGHQIQNLVAADPSRWSVRMAEDVIIDAHLLASCNAFIHVTSNIATAVSYINPDVEMIYCE